MASLHLLSDHSTNHKVSPTNLLDELSADLKEGTATATKLMILHLQEDGTLRVLTTPMAHYEAMGLLAYASSMLGARTE